MYCYRCGKENDESAIYCISCGAKLDGDEADTNSVSPKAPPAHPLSGPSMAKPAPYPQQNGYDYGPTPPEPGLVYGDKAWEILPTPKRY